MARLAAVVTIALLLTVAISPPAVISGEGCVFRVLVSFG